MSSSHPDLVSTGVTLFLEKLRHRWIRLRIVDGIMWGALSALSSLFYAYSLAGQSMEGAIFIGAGTGGVAALVFICWTLLGQPDQRAIARLADRRFALEEKLSSVIELYSRTPVRGAVAEALLSQTSSAIEGIRPGVFEKAFSAPRIWLGGAVLLVGGMAAASLGMHPAIDAPATPRLDATGIAAMAQEMRQDAALRDDEELAGIADRLDDLAESADRISPEVFEREVFALAERAALRFGRNPAHAAIPFEGNGTSAAVPIEAAGQGFLGENTGGSAPSGAASGQTMESDPPSDAIRTTSLPGAGQDGVSLGLAPPDNARNGGMLDAEGEGHDASMDMPQTGGDAEGAGSGLSNMAGSGALDTGNPAPAPPVIEAGVGETQELTAAQMSEGSTIRLAVDIEESTSVAADGAPVRTWRALEGAPVERTAIPSGAARAVERYFIRNIEARS